MEVSYSIRRGTPADSYAVFLLFEETLADLLIRLGQNPRISHDDPGKLAKMWGRRQNLFDFMAVHADEFWIAEADGRPIGYARSMMHGNVRELNEFFVRPTGQGSGAGRELLELAFPTEPGVERSIIASLDLPAQVRYLKAGMTHRFMVMYFFRAPAERSITGDLVAELMPDTEETLGFLAEIDSKIIGFTRPKWHRFLLGNRTCYRYLGDGGKILGYGYVGVESGPFALLVPSAIPDVLAHAESEAARREYRHFGLELAMVDGVAVNTLLSRGFRLDPFLAVYMSTRPLLVPENYIISSPPFGL